MPNPETLDQPGNLERPDHGTPVCVECKINAVWIKSKKQLCWWCEGEPAINQKLSPKKGTERETPNAKRSLHPKKEATLGPT